MAEYPVASVCACRLVEVVVTKDHSHRDPDRELVGDETYWILRWSSNTATGYDELEFKLRPVFSSAA